MTLLALLTWPVSKRWLGNWGASAAERSKNWPGDDLVGDRAHTYTRAIDIAAPDAQVWPWVVQFGLGRAGFYSYELLERMTGIPVKNVEAILPEHQSLAVGGTIKLHPKDPGIPVGIHEPPNVLCFGEQRDAPLSPDSPDPRRSWSIYVVPRSSTSSRLILRGCIEPTRQPSLGKRIAASLTEPIDFAMEQRMLRTLRRLASSS